MQSLQGHIWVDAVITRTCLSWCSHYKDMSGLVQSLQGHVWVGAAITRTHRLMKSLQGQVLVDAVVTRTHLGPCCHYKDKSWLM